MLNDIHSFIASRWPRWRPVARVRRGPLPVMFVITSMPVGGAETLLANLLENLDPKKIKPEIVCLKAPGPLGEKLKAKYPVHHHVLGCKWDLRVLPRLISLFRRRNAAAVITVGAGDKMFWGRLAAWLAGVPTIFSALHSTGWPDGVGRLNRLLTPITDGFIAVADSHAEYMRENERFPANRVYTIRNGIDAKRFHQDSDARERTRNSLGIDLDAPVFGIIAALRPEKNHAMFLRAARAISAICPESRFLIVGDGPERSTIEEQITKLHLESHVQLLGTRHDTPELLNAMDVFVLSSLNEASPVSILEALACELPVVATNVGSVSETVIEGKTGYLVDVDDDRSMIECMRALLDESCLRTALGMNGRTLVEQTGSLQSMVDGYTTLIENCYDQRAAKRNRPEMLTDRRRFPRHVPAEKQKSIAPSSDSENLISPTN